MAARHFDIPMERVKNWVKRRGSSDPKATPPDPKSGPKPSRSAPPLEAYTPHARDSLRAGFGAAQGYGRIAARHVEHYESVLAERDRQRKLGVPDNALPELPPLLDPAWLVAAHRAQKLALEIAPGLATFDAALLDPATQVGPVAVDPVALAEEVRRRMRAPPVVMPTPSLRVVK